MASTEIYRFPRISTEPGNSGNKPWPCFLCLLGHFSDHVSLNTIHRLWFLGYRSRMVKPSDLFLRRLKDARGSRKLSGPSDLQGFRQDLHEYIDQGEYLDRDNSQRIWHINHYYSDDETCKIVSEFEVRDSRPWPEIKNEILRAWNDEIAYTHSGYEFTESPGELVFHFFSFEDDDILFVTGQAIFRRS